jgi:hypothetical protein
MSTSYPDTNLPANVRPPSKSRRANSVKHQDSAPPPTDDDWPLANVFAQILNEDFPMEAPARAGSIYPQGGARQQPRPYTGVPPLVVDPALPQVRNEDTIAATGDIVIEIKRVRSHDRDGVVVFFSAKYRKPLFVILIIFLMAATGNLSEIIQFIVKYL